MSIVQLPVFPQQKIKVEVDYYNEKHKNLLLEYPLAKKIEELVKDGVEVPIEEFLTYYLFSRKRPGKDGWRDYNEVGRKIYKAWVDLEDYIEFNGESINTAENVEEQVGHITEYIGESIGLAIINRIHELTAADWGRIPEHSGKGGFKTFDYQIASDGNEIIQVENKGSSVEDNTKKCPAISNHKKNVETKKIEIASRTDNQDYPYPASVRYGTISVLGNSNSNPAKCLLLDPPSEGDGTLARKLKLLNRMSFLRDWITFISPRAPFSAALQTRFASLSILADPFELNDVELLKGNGEPFNFLQVNGNSSFFTVKSKVLNGGVGGVVVPLTDGNLFFLGIRDALVELASGQQLQEILSYSAQSENGERTVECVLSARAFEDFRLTADIKKSAFKNAGYYYFQLKGHLFYSDSGIVFGPLFIKSES